MTSDLDLRPDDLAKLERNPECEVACHGKTGPMSLRLAIPNHAEQVAAHYGRPEADGEPAMPFAHLGLICTFDEPSQVAVCDAERRLDEGLRALIGRYGALILRNAYPETSVRQDAQRNIFPSLHFHIDRGPTQPDRISMFFRDPFDEIHREPRQSSTLILANRVAYLQALKEGAPPHEFRSLYQLFESESVETLAGRILIDQRWSAPRGTGEICLIDNASVLHASYYQGPKGYPIGVRYLF